MLLSAVMDNYCIVLLAESASSDWVEACRMTFQAFLDFTGEMAISELEALHVLLFISTEKIKAERNGVEAGMPYPDEEYQILRRFIRWLLAQKPPEPEPVGPRRKPSPGSLARQLKRRPPSPGGRFYVLAQT